MHAALKKYHSSIFCNQVERMGKIEGGEERFKN